MDLTAVTIEVDKSGNVSYGTGLAMEIPFGYVGYIFPRSSVSKYALDLANAVGVIDSGYRGEIICKFKPTPMFTNNAELNTNLLANNEMYEIGDRVAQIIIMPLPHVTFHEVKELSNTDRGDGGFGSTNK
jgi:dUTP pyrophosphatase